MDKKNKKQRNLPAQIISIVFAIILWFIAIGEENPEFPRSYEGIPVRMRNESQLSSRELGLVYDIEEPVTIRLKGRGKDLNRVEEDKLRGYIDLSDIDKPGEHKVRIEVEGIPMGIRLEKHPERTILVDRIATKQVPVEVEIKGREAADYQMQPYTVKPDKVTIAGPETIVDKVVRGRVSLDLKQSKSTVEQSLPIKLLDEKDQNIESKFLSLYQDFAIVTVPIYPKKDLAIKAVISGKPAEGYEVGEIEVQPKEVVVSGSEKLLNEMEFVSTELIDINDVKADVKRTVKLQNYDGIYLDPAQPSEVSVLIRIEPAEIEQELSEQKIDVENLEEDRKAELSTELANIVLKGNKATIDHMENGTVRVYVDLKGMSRGERALPLKVSVPEGVEVISMNPQKVTVNIE